MRRRQKRSLKEVQYRPQLLRVTLGTASPALPRPEVLKVRVEKAHPALPVLGAARAKNDRRHEPQDHRQGTKFLPTLSLPLAPPPQPSARRACPPAQTTARLSLRQAAALAVSSNNTPSPRASQSHPSVHRVNPLPPLSLLTSVCPSPPKASTPLPCRQTRARPRPRHRPVVAWGPRTPGPLHVPPRPQVHWPQDPASYTTSGSVRRILSTGKPPRPPLSPKPNHQKALDQQDPQPQAMASL